MTQSEGFSALIITSITFGLFGVLATVLGTSFSPVVIALYISVIQVIGFFLLIIFKKEKLSIDRSTILFLILLLIIKTLPFFLFNISVRLTSIGSVLIAQNVSAILFGFIYEYFVDHTQIDIKQVLLIVLAIMGIASLYIPFHTISFLGILAATGTGVANGFANTLRGRLAIRYSTLSLSFYTASASTIIWLAMTFLFSQHFSLQALQNTNTLVLLLLYGVLQMLTTALLFVGFKIVRVTIGNLVLMLEIIFGLLAGSIFLHQYIGIKDIMITCMVIISILIVRIIDLEEAANIVTTKKLG